MIKFFSSILQKNKKIFYLLYILENNLETSIKENTIIDTLANNNNNLYDEISDKKVFDNNIKEVDLDKILEEKDKIDLKDAEMVYYEIYKAARKKAKEIKKNAIEAYLEVKKIKNQYMLNDMSGSDDSDIEELENNI